MQATHTHSQSSSAGLYPSAHPSAISVPFQGMNVLLPVHMNGMNVNANRGVNLSMPVNMMGMGMAMGVPYASAPAQIHSQPPVNMYYHPHPHAHPHAVPSHPHGHTQSHSHSQGHGLPLGSPTAHVTAAAHLERSVGAVDEEEKDKQSKAANRQALRNGQGNGAVLHSDAHSRGPQQSQLQAFLPAKVVALATPALSAVLSAPATPNAANPNNNAAMSLSLAAGSSASAANSAASAVSSSLPSSIAALEEYYYQLLSPFLSHFRRADSALVWLCRASPSSSFSLAVPRVFRNPKSSGGEGGYADAFKKLGLSLRDKERRSGHFHLWYCDVHTVNLAALQTALKKRWTESDQWSDRELDELMAQANTKNKKEQREEPEEREPMQERKDRKEKARDKEVEMDKEHANEKNAFIDLSTIQSHVSAARSHSASNGMNIHAKRMSVQQHFAKKHKDKDKESGSAAASSSNQSASAKTSAGSVHVALPASVPMPVLDMAMSLGAGSSMEEYYPNGLHGVHGSIGSQSAKEFSASNGVGKEWKFEKEFDSDVDSSAKAMDCGYHFQAPAAPGYPSNAYFPQANYFVYHPAVHAPQVHSLLPHSSNSLPMHAALSVASAGRGSVGLHSAYADVPLGVLSGFASPPHVFHRQSAAANYFRGSAPAFVEYEDERRLKRSYEANNKMAEESGQAPLKKLTTPSASLPTAPSSTSRCVASPAPAPMVAAAPIKSLLTSSSTFALKLTAATQSQGNAAQLPAAMHKDSEAAPMDGQVAEAAAAVDRDGDGSSTAMDEDRRSSADAEVVGHLLQLKALPNPADSSAKAFYSKPPLSAPQAQCQAEMMSG